MGTMTKQAAAYCKTHPAEIQRAFSQAVVNAVFNHEREYAVLVDEERGVYIYARQPHTAYRPFNSEILGIIHAGPGHYIEVREDFIKEVVESLMKIVDVLEMEVNANE